MRLFIGKKSEISYTVNIEGEAFGWTGLVDRPVYTATAECGVTSKIMKIENKSLIEIFEKDPASA